MSESSLSEQVGVVAAGYAFEGAALELGRLVEAAQPDAATAVDVKIPLAMLNRHGLIAGATRLDEAAKKRAADEAAEQAAKDAGKQAKSRPTSRSSGSSKKDDGGIISDIAGSKQFKDFLRDSGKILAEEIARGVFKIGRR